MANVGCSLTRPPEARSLDGTLFQRLYEDRRQVISGWSRRGIAAEGGHFQGFIYLWFAMNGWGACVADTDRDREWVNAVALDQHLGRTFTELIKADQTFEAKARDFRNLWPIFRSSDIRRQGIHVPAGSSRAERIEHYLAHGLTEFEPSCWHEHDRNPPLDWPHSFRSLYRVRCNLFHGEKTLDSDNDRIIIETAYSVLASFVREADLFEVSR